MKMQPFVDLTKGTGASGETLLLDYTAEPKAIVWAYQIRSTNFRTLANSRLTDRSQVDTI